MSDTIYIDNNTRNGDGPTGIILTRDAAVIYTGLEIQIERGALLLAEISRLCGLNFFQEDPKPAAPLYGVPCISVFASDGRGGWFVCRGDLEKEEIYFVTPELSVHPVADWFGALMEEAIRDPDWRRKRLPGGPWPRLPEDRAGRETLANALRFPRPAPGKSDTAEPPRIFPSRAEAEKVFPILDIWTALRWKKTPRFQIHSMMSPADREGRAFVHYTAWRETYTGLMPDVVLEAHTLEKYRDLANTYRSNTFVALDRDKDDRVAGFACFQRKARDFVSVPDAAEITALYVLREYQGLGLGRMLLEQCVEMLHRDKIALFVLKGNENAIRFYEHMGFRMTGHVASSHDGALTELEMCLDRRDTVTE